MKRISGIAVLSILLLGSASAMAQGLTPKQCNSYPFTHLSQPATHKQLMRELGELESVGYDPSANDNSYPNQLDQAEAKLQAEYRADCMPASAHTTSAPSTGNAANSSNPAS